MRSTLPRMTTGLGAVVLLALLVLASRKIDLSRLVVELRTVRLTWLAGALVSYAAILPLWALEWRLLAPATPRNTFARMLGVCAMTSTMLNTAPMFVGEVSAAVWLVTRIGLTRSAAFSLIAIDQLLVGVAKLVVLAAAALLLAIPPWMQRGMVALLLGVAALLAGVLLIAWHPDALATRFGGRLPARSLAALRGLGEALAPLRSPSRSGGSLLVALSKKLAEIVAIVCVQRAFGVELPVSAAILLLAALGLATMLPLIPSSFGLFEGAVVLTYAHLGVSYELALGMAIVQHACFFASAALPGYAWFASSPAARSAPAAP